MTASDFTGQLTTIEGIKNFVLAGNATITIRSQKTETRFTFRIRPPKENRSRPIWFVSALTGSDNNSTYQYLGHIRHDLSYDHGRKSRITVDAESAKAFRWFWHMVEGGNCEHGRAVRLFEQLEIWHEGRCGRCGRKLTVPESIESGFGPDCIQLIGLAA